MEKYEYLTEEDKQFLRPETNRDIKCKQVAMKDAFNELLSRIVLIENDQTMTYGEIIAAKFIRNVLEHPTAKNVETLFKLKGEFEEKLNIDLNPAQELFDCKVEDD